MWIIGVDGGGSKCKAGLFNLQGELLAATTTGPANIYSDLNEAKQSIDKACQLLFREVSQRYQLSVQAKDCVLSAGCAGAGIPSAYDKFMSTPSAFAKRLLHTDIHISCLAANNKQDCALLICGTGSCIAHYSEKETQQFGGHGFLLGDVGSGAWLGRRAVSCYLQYIDKHKEDELENTSDPLIKRMLVELGDDSTAIVTRFSHAPAQSFAALVPMLLNSDSPTVNNFIAAGIDYFTAVLSKQIPADTPMFIDGGLAKVYQEKLSSTLGEVIQSPQKEAIWGAYLAAI